MNDSFFSCCAVIANVIYKHMFIKRCTLDSIVCRWFQIVGYPLPCIHKQMVFWGYFIPLILPFVLSNQLYYHRSTKFYFSLIIFPRWCQIDITTQFIKHILSVLLYCVHTCQYGMETYTSHGVCLFLLKMAQNIKKNIYSSVLHSHTVLMKLCPCGSHRQLNSVLYPNNRILKSSKIIINRLVLKEFSTCRQFESR